MSSRRSCNRTERTAAKWRGPGRGGWALIALAAICSAIGAGTGTAVASSRFVYEVCDSALPGGNTPGVQFHDNPGTAYSAANTCAQPGGSLSITETGTVEATFGFWDVPVATVPGGEIESLAVSSAACVGGAAWAFVMSRGWPTESCGGGEVQRIFHGPLTFGGTSIFLGCDGNKGACGAGPQIYAHYFAATEVDRSAPVVSAVGGSLLGGGPIRGHQTIGAELSDVGGGLSEAAVLVNGTIAGKPVSEACSELHVSNPSVVGTVSGSVSPCPNSAELGWTLDSESYPFHDGLNSVQVCGWDFASVGEPSRGCSVPQEVDVDNSCTASAVDGGELLSAQFAASHAETVTVRQGRWAEVQGRLATNADDPVRGATLCVKMETLGVESRPATVGSVVTDANGEYSYRLAAGPNRQLVIGYRHDSRQVARDVHYYAHVVPSLALAPPVLGNGESVHLWGRLPGPRPERRVVVLQANAPGSRRWITFRRASTDANGAFHSSYRFASTTRKTRYRFRALVPRQAGYPWIEGHSKPVSVTVSA